MPVPPRSPMFPPVPGTRPVARSIHRPNSQATRAPGRRWRRVLPALLAVPLLAWAAQAAAPPAAEPCAPWAGPFANVDASVDAAAPASSPAAGGDTAPFPEPEDVNEVDTDPLDALPLEVAPGTPPQVLAMRLDQARQRGHALVLLLPVPADWPAGTAL